MARQPHHLFAPTWLVSSSSCEQSLRCAAHMSHITQHLHDADHTRAAHDDLCQEILVADLERNDTHHLIERLALVEALYKVRRLFPQCLDPSATRTSCLALHSSTLMAPHPHHRDLATTTQNAKTPKTTRCRNFASAVRNFCFARAQHPFVSVQQFSPRCAELLLHQKSLAPH